MRPFRKLPAQGGNRKAVLRPDYSFEAPGQGRACADAEKGKNQSGGEPFF